MSQEFDRADPAFRRDLGDGLLLRWSTAADADAIAQLQSFVYRSSADAPPLNERVTDRVRRQMRGNYLMEPGDYALVEDTSRDGHPLVACSCLWHHTWEFAGIPFGVGRPEYVATDPAFRNRGLVRAIFSLLHARSAARGDRMQAITGIPYFYRQFGYEYALDLDGSRTVPISLIPSAKEGESEPYTLREATAEDLPILRQFHDQRRAEMLIWSVIPEAFWRYQLVDLADWQIPSKRGTFQMIVDQTGNTVGYLYTGIRRWGANLTVHDFEAAGGTNLRAILPPILRQLQQHGQSIPAIDTTEPLRGIQFQLGREHPVYDVLGSGLASVVEPPYAWYIRVPDIPGFLTHVAPVLEQRLAGSPLANYTGELKMDWYRGGMRLAFVDGKLTASEPWQAPTFGENAQAGCPELVFIQLLTGYRSIAELRAIYPDVEANDEAHMLLSILFPKRPSSVMG
jgi:hypothetical protein